MKETLTPAGIWNRKNFPDHGQGQTGLPKGAALGLQLRSESGGFLPQRRGIAALSLVAIGAMGVIALYQIGLFKHLPDLPLPTLDSDRVDAAPEAYEKLDTPDGVLGVNSYAITMALAAMGGRDRARKRPWIPLALAGKVGFDLAQMVRMVRVQWSRYRAFSFWSLIPAIATMATAALAWGEAREARRAAFQHIRWLRKRVTD